MKKLWIIFNLAAVVCSLCGAFGCSKKKEPVAPTTATLQIFSKPSGATVTVDGADRGKTPLILGGVSLAHHEVGISLEPYFSRSEVLNILSPEDVRRDYLLFPTARYEIRGKDAAGWRQDTLFRLPVDTVWVDLTFNAVPPVTETLIIEDWVNRIKELTNILVMSPSDSGVVILFHRIQNPAAYQEKFFWQASGYADWLPIAEPSFTVYGPKRKDSGPPERIAGLAIINKK